MIDVEEEPEAFARVDRRLLRHLVEFLRPHRGLLGLGVLLLALGFTADLLGPYWIRLTTDGPVKDALLGLTDSRAAALREIALYVALFFAASFAGAILNYFQMIVLSLAGQRVTYDVRNRLYSHLLSLPQSFFDRKPVGELVTRITSDVENLAELFSSGVATFLFDMLRVVGVLVVLFVIQPVLALVVVAGLPVYVLLSFRFRTRARLAYRETRRELARANAFAQESLAGMAVIQLSVQEGRTKERFHERGRSLRNAWMGTVRQYALFLPLVEFANQCVVVATFGVSAWMILDGVITAGVFVQYWFYLRLIFEPIAEIAERYNVLQSALSSTERIVGLLDQKPEPPGTVSHEIQGLVEFDRVHFSYEGGSQALRDVSFRIHAGETIAVVGATGAGKTTLTQLLLHLYRVQSGAVKVDRVPVSEWRLEDLRGGIGVVPQEVFLFADTILENVRLRDPGISEAAVEEACRLVSVDTFVRRLPEGYHSLVGERGINLSAGQRQLLAFARILVHQPRIVILDEATSSVDSETEWMLQRAVERVIQGRTCIIIAHRLSTIRLAARVFVLHHGQLRESGTHEELLQRDGIYTRLYRLQFGTA